MNKPYNKSNIHHGQNVPYAMNPASLYANTLENKTQELNQMLRAYNRELVDQGFGIKRADLRKKDFIDIRSILTMPNNKTSAPSSILSPEEREFGKQNFWFSTVPCFTEGVLQINDCRYIYWNMTDIQPHYDNMTLILHDYIFYEDIGWQPGVVGTVKLNFIKDECYIDLQFEDDSVQLYSDIYQMISYKRLGWTTNQIKMWESEIIKHAKDTEDDLKIHGTDQFQELTMLFLRYISKVNYMLSLNKPKITKTHQKTVTANTKIEIVNNDNESKTQERRVRTIGSIPITSKDIPRLPTEKTVIRYKVASWKTRGFIRKYSNGKTVHVKESIHHRKCLQEKDHTPVTIKLTSKEAPNDPKTKQ